MTVVPVLFARSDSVYYSFPQCDVFDLVRDARSFDGSLPVIAHPPCRAWSRLAHLAKPRPDEKDLAFFALDLVRRNGGVLEHPFGSQFWKSASLPRSGFSDSYGFTLYVEQVDFGHRALKPTWLYICGLSSDLVKLPPSGVFAPTMPVQNMSRSEREKTPVLFARFLVDLVALIGGAR